MPMFHSCLCFLLYSLICMNHENQKNLIFYVVSSFFGFIITMCNWQKKKFLFSWLLLSQKQLLLIFLLLLLLIPLSKPLTRFDQVLIPLDTTWPFDQVLTSANLDSFVEDIRQDWIVLLPPIPVIPIQRMLVFTFYSQQGPRESENVWD